MSLRIPRARFVSIHNFVAVFCKLAQFFQELTPVREYDISQSATQEVQNHLLSDSVLIAQLSFLEKN